MKRYVILSGDKTTVGGTVQATVTTLQLNSVHVAHEDDAVACPACHSTGKIQCSGGPRLPMNGPDGRRIALHDDLCICECQPPPRLVASQTVMGTSNG
ncbi:PAAR domain-containing protein (plasmid) [Ralstonia solanacearum]|uniref:PAAR domain-containing protein n=1 Tax=Ralstonia solanacearum TaxID=305 RepID=A0A0S4WJQ1_RALSL|nr:PAAR domain-containing protein [Ralstonia solanacearum]QKL79213.1 PAAR domain-containing protein [Ralstonia solanacearum]QKL84422.1 PAAR domain-containing protein [Ralstonia solanacearum]QKL89635.1 PAAR domain-containing protein [Ralstonia solanacearum]QKM05000.1 PAAR domain-containing protein [Ralstonia solanacearum]